MAHPLRWLALLAAALSLAAWPAPPASADEPPGPAAVCPAALVLGQIFDCELGAVGERDTFALQAAQGERFAVRMSLLAGSLYPQALVRDAAGNPVAGCAAHGSTVVAFVCAPPSAGSYTLDVGDFYNRNMGDYALYVQSLSSPGNAQALPFGRQVGASLASPIASDAYRVTAVGSEKVLLRLRHDGGAFLPALTVFDQAGRQVCAADGTPLVDLTCALGGAGDYTVMVDDRLLSRTGAYTLLAERLGSPADAQPIEPGERLSGALGAGSPSRKYSFSAQRGEVVLLRAQRRSGGVSLRLGLYDAGGDQVCADEGSPLARVERCVIQGDGLHTILVDDKDMLGSGQFTLFTQRLNNPGQYRVLGFAQRVPGLLTLAGGFDTYTFAGEAGDAVALTLRRTAGAFTPRVRVYSPSGAEVCAAEGDLAGRTIGCALREAGAHTMLVDDAQAQLTGEYALTLVCQRGSCLGGAPHVRYLPFVRR